MSFQPNPRFVEQLFREKPMRDFVGGVADRAAKEIETRLPYPDILGGLQVSARTNLSTFGWEGEARVTGSGWHLWEYGTRNHPARPAIRPGAQAALSRYGGRLGESR